MSRIRIRNMIYAESVIVVAVTLSMHTNTEMVDCYFLLSIVFFEPVLSASVCHPHQTYDEHNIIRCTQTYHVTSRTGIRVLGYRFFIYL